MNHVTKKSATIAGALALATLALVVRAQDFSMHRGDAGRTGHPTLSASTPPGTPASTYNDPGRAFLRWWDPLGAQRSELDNGHPSTAAVPAGQWIGPSINTGTRAFNFVQQTVGAPEYLWTTTVPAINANNPTVPGSGTLRTHEWRFSGLAAGDEYAVYVNIPLGPTDVDNNPATNTLQFPQQHYVFQVEGVVGGPITQIVDTFLEGGAYVRLGEQNLVVDTGNQITVRLFNTTPRAGDGTFLDREATPGEELVYADSALLVSYVTGEGVIEASAVVSELTQAPPIGGPTAFPRRVVSARNESTHIGDIDATVDYGIVTSFAYDGSLVDIANRDGRRNIVWSWPVRRPFDATTAELERYARDKRDWAMGPSAEQRRSMLRVQLDNLSGGASSSGAFGVDTALAGFLGANYAVAPAIVGTADSAVTWAPNLPEGRYRIQIHLPNVSTGNVLAEGATYQVLVNGVPVRTETINQRANLGWVDFPFSPSGGWTQTDTARLSVRVLNGSTLPSDAGRLVWADAVRFVKDADLGVSSTPVQTTARVRVGATTEQRDVVIVAMENGRIYCMDAHGDPVTGAPPQIYWVYPSETPVDPNAVAGEDGVGRVAEMPTEFDLSSALVANVGGEDLLFIGTQNGRVYAIEMEGRGDGTTRRRWTFPDDYNPSAPELPIAPSALGPIEGSVAFGEPGGLPTLFVPTSQGRLIALDAAGNAATRTTTVRWQYPALTDTPLGPITMTPMVANNRVIFGAPRTQTSSEGVLYALDWATGAVLATEDEFADGEPFGAFGTSSGVVVPQALVPGLGQDAVAFHVPTGSGATSVNRILMLGLDFSTLWETDELSTTVNGSLGFTHMTVYNNAGTPTPNVPVVVVPGGNGSITALFADGSTNRQGTRRAWAYVTEGTPVIASPALGGKHPTEAHSWMYIGDGEGFFYAFNHDPDLDDGNQVLLPGPPPGGQQAVENDPAFDELADIISDSGVVFLAPAVYEQLVAELNAGTLTYGDLTAARANARVTRAHFEMGETLYLLVFELSLPTSASLANYYVEVAIDMAGQDQRRQIQPRAIPAGVTPVGEEQVALSAFPLIPTGGQGMAPGPNTMRVRAVAPGLGNARSPEVQRSYIIAHPLAVRMFDGATSRVVGMTTNAADASVIANGNSGQVEPFGAFGPSLTSLGTGLGHGTTGVSRMNVVDRSLMRLILGANRGLQNVRVSPRNLAWVRTVGDPTGGVFKPFDTTVFPGFEDFPVHVPNTSIDYPDVTRDALRFTKELFGETQNPLFSGISLNPPVIQQADLDNYRTTAGFNAQMARTLRDTVLDVGLLVPRFQPPSRDGYYGTQTVYVDRENPGRDAGEAYRNFGMRSLIMPDERIAIGTPTIDLGSLPSGGGFDGGAGGGPAAPWSTTTLFSPWNPRWSAGGTPMFQRFSVHNTGNVNLLNVRVAKELAEPVGAVLRYRPLELYAPGLHELSWLDASLHLHSDLDPRFSASFLAGVDTNARNILQKPRVGDLAPTQLSTNPVRRPNANAAFLGGPLLDPTAFPMGDPRVGVSAPVGTPSGAYFRQVYVFEDAGNNRVAGLPALDTGEAFSDPTIQLRFSVREARLTTGYTLKGAPMVDNAPNLDFNWANTMPAAMRAGDGTLFFAWTSNRLTSADAPGWDLRARAAGDMATQDSWRIYIGSIRGDVTAAQGESPIADFNGFLPGAPDRWVTRAVTSSYPASFTFTLQPGESLVPNSANFSAPVFPAGGAFDLTQAPTATGRVAQRARYMAFLGEALKVDGAGTRRRLNQVMLAGVTLNTNGTASVSAPLAIPFDVESRKSRPALVQVGTLATVFYTNYATSLGQIQWNSFNGRAFLPTQSLRLGNGFEWVGAPSASIRRFRNQSNETRINMTFTAKQRGRANTEAFMVQLGANMFGFPVGRNPIVPFAVGVDPLVSDPATGVFWAPGSQWRLTANEVNPANPNRIDLLRLRNGVLESVLDYASLQYDQDRGVIRANTVLGGQAFLDANTGSVTFSNAVIPSGLRLFVRSAPQVLRLSTGIDANYRSTAMEFDDRFIGVTVNPANPQRNLLSELSYWARLGGTPAQPTDLIRNDRLIVAFTRTAARESAGADATTRPFMRTFRFGLRLPTAIAVAPDGRVNVMVSGSSAPFYQVDPTRNRVYFPAEAEGDMVTVQYTGVDEAGNTFSASFTGQVQLVGEMEETAVPIEQPGNESGIALALDPMNSTFNRQDFRRPGVMWLFWSSTRAGSQDIFFQTLAPRFSPRPPGQ